MELKNDSCYATNQLIANKEFIDLSNVSRLPRKLRLCFYKIALFDFIGTTNIVYVS